MASSVPNPLPGAPRKNLAARLVASQAACERGDSLTKRVLGAVIESALHGAGLTKQQMSREMGYGDNQAPISNWISGKENPQLSRLWSVRAFRAPFVVALAGACDCDVDVKTIVTVSPRKARA